MKKLVITITLAFLVFSFTNGTTPKNVKLITIKNYTPTNVLISTEVEEYSTAGLMIKKAFYKPHHLLNFYTIYEYDSLNRLSKETEYKADSSISSTWEYWYNEKGDLIKQKRFYSENNSTYIESYLHTYNANGQIIKTQETYKDGSKGFTYTFEYDAFGHEINYKSFFNKKPKTEYVSVYVINNKTLQYLYSYENKKGIQELHELTSYDYKDTLMTKKIVQSVASHLSSKVISTYEYLYTSEGYLGEVLYSVDEVLDNKKKYEYEFYK
ncbi:MAG: hypothetical protein U0U66_03490 [Cytophagaceae bacterium]